METMVQDLLTPIKGSPRKPRRARSTPWLVKLLRVYFNIVGRVFPGRAAHLALKMFGKTRSRYSNGSFMALTDKAQSFTVVSDGLEINGHIWDHQGPTVMLVHGWETSGLHLGGFIEPLWALGFRIVTFDGPAHGSSQGTHASLIHFSRAILKVVEKVGKVDHMIGHSFGGVASVYTAAVNDEVKLDKMVLISTPNKLIRIIAEFARYLGIPPTVERKMYEEIRTRFKVDPNEVEISKLGRSMAVRELLVVHDHYDEIVPFYNSLEIIYALPQASLLECEYLGHNRILKNPQVITRVGQFLKDQLKY